MHLNVGQIIMDAVENGVHQGMLWVNQQVKEGNEELAKDHEAAIHAISLHVMQNLSRVIEINEHTGEVTEKVEEVQPGAKE